MTMRRWANPRILFIVAAIGCAGLTEPRKVPASLQVVAGLSQTDTIGVWLSIPLTVSVHDTRGKPAIKTPVTFTVLPIPGAASSPAVVNPTTYVYEFGPQTAMKEWTDSSGRTAVSVKLGTIAGRFRIAIDGNDLPVHDTVSYTVLPGHPVRITTTPADTALYVGASYGVASQVLDRAGNVRSDSISATLDSGATVASVQPNRLVTGLAFGRARVGLALGDSSVVAVARVTVVPRGTLGVSMNGYALDWGIARVDLDGSGYRLLVSMANNYTPFPSWSPDGSNIVYNTNAFTGGLMRVDTLGHVAAIAHTGVLSSETWPRYSYDGKYIYYTGGYYPDSLDSYRINADGSGTPLLVTPPRPVSERYWKASPSPDGSLVAYTVAGSAVSLVSTIDGSNRTLSTPTSAESPRFSPDGTWIAFVDEESRQLHIVHPDGSGFRTLTPAGLTVDHWGHDWSPDGAWIVIRTDQTAAIVRVSDGLILPLPYARDMFEPTWRP